MRHLLNPRKRRKKTAQEDRDEKVQTTIEQLKEKQSILFKPMQLRIWSESVVDGNHSSLEEAPTLSELVRVPQLKRKSRATHLMCLMP